MQAFPLQWVAGRPRTKSPKKARFDVSFTEAYDHIQREARRMGFRSMVVSTNLELRNDGLPYAQQRKLDDCGVAVYIIIPDMGDEWFCFSCDKWDEVKHNMRAIAKTMEAIRGIERWGSGDMMRAAFTGFKALPNSTSGVYWKDYIEDDISGDKIKVEFRFKKLMQENHPDKGGDVSEFIKIKEARDQYIKFIKDQSLS